MKILKNFEEVVTDGKMETSKEGLMARKIEASEETNSRGCERRVQISCGATDNGSISKDNKIKHVLQPQNTSLKRRVYCSMLMMIVIKQRHQYVSFMTPTDAN